MKTLGYFTVTCFLCWIVLTFAGINIFNNYNTGMLVFSIVTLTWVFTGLLWCVLFDIYHNRQYKKLCDQHDRMLNELMNK